MISIGRIGDSGLRVEAVHAERQLTADVCWVDAERPTTEERQWILRVYGQPLPTRIELSEIEATSRFYEDDTGLHLHAYFLREATTRPRNTTVAFILNSQRLFTLRDIELPSFRKYQETTANHGRGPQDAFNIMLSLFELNVDRMADLLEQLHVDLETLGDRVFHTAESDFDAMLASLSTIQDRNDKIRLGLLDRERSLSFLLRRGHCPEPSQARLEEVLRDIRSLNEHAAFLLEKVQFLMDATMGRIGIQQNKIIKIFSIAAVVFLPPTLIASIYGMNFRFLPELAWPFGYPLALVLMVLAGFAPYWYFKRKGWF